MVDNSTPSILAIIPARGGSKGLPGKNIRELLGKPLIAHSLAVGSQLGPAVRCVVSTDDPEIARVAKEWGGEVPFLRPAELATDTAPMGGVLRHALLEMEKQTGARYDTVLLLDPTSPIRSITAITDAMRMLASREDLDGVISVSQPFFNPTWVGVRETAEEPPKLVRYFEEGHGVTRRQDTSRFLRINGSFYVWRSDFIRRLERSWFDEGTHAGFEVPEAHAFAIDEEAEFLLVEAVVRAGLAPLPGWDTRQKNPA